MTRCRSCEAHSRALSSINEALAAAALALGGAEGCTCPDDRVTEPPNASEATESIDASLVSMGYTIRIRYGLCGHEVRALEHERAGLCRRCWRNVDLHPVGTPYELADAEDARAAECEGQSDAAPSPSAAAFLRELAARARANAMRLRALHGAEAAE